MLYKKERETVPQEFLVLFLSENNRMRCPSLAYKRIHQKYSASLR
ncbi:MAG: hypothetical protein K6G82_05510 [Ruminococcus sp.]|nr:hypothetical protein [Ruminococcus sp.]